MTEEFVPYRGPTPRSGATLKHRQTRQRNRYGKRQDAGTEEVRVRNSVRSSLREKSVLRRGITKSPFYPRTKKIRDVMSPLGRIRAHHPRGKRTQTIKLYWRRDASAKELPSLMKMRKNRKRLLMLKGRRRAHDVSN